MDNVLSRRKMHKDTEVDWRSDYSVYAINTSTMQFENCSMVGADEDIFLNIYRNSADYSERVSELAKERKASILLYTEDHWCVGFVATRDFRITDFMPMIGEMECAALIRFYYEDKNSEEMETLYHATDKNDFKYLVDKYSIEIAVNLYKQCAYFLDGLAFTEPKILDSRSMCSFVNDVYDEEFFKKLIDNNTISDIEKYVDVKGAFNFINRKNKE